MNISNNNIANKDKKKPSYLRAIWITAIPLVIFIAAPLLISSNCHSGNDSSSCIGAGYAAAYCLIAGVPVTTITLIVSLSVIRYKRNRNDDNIALANSVEQQSTEIGIDVTSDASVESAVADKNNSVKDSSRTNSILFIFCLTFSLIGIFILSPLAITYGPLRAISVFISIVYIAMNFLIITTQYKKAIRPGDLWVVLVNLLVLLITTFEIFEHNNHIFPMSKSLYGSPIATGPSIIAVVVFVLYLAVSSNKKALGKKGKTALLAASVVNIALSIFVLLSPAFIRV